MVGSASLCGSVVPPGFYRVGKHPRHPMAASHPTQVVVTAFVPHLDAIDDLPLSRPPEWSSAEQSVFHAQQLVLILGGPLFQEGIGSFDLEIDDPSGERDSREKYEHLSDVSHFTLLDDD